MILLGSYLVMYENIEPKMTTRFYPSNARRSPDALTTFYLRATNPYVKNEEVKCLLGN